jgi:hypothetical protein
MISNAEQSAEWVIGEIRNEADASTGGLSELDLRFLRMAVSEVPEHSKHFFLASHNLAVELIRMAIESAKERGDACVQVRQGLSLPEVWQAHYEVIYASELPWLISLAMQNAFLGNPLAGEEEPWFSP